MDDDPDVMDVIRYLCDYLRCHPQSADTADGIAHWWFGEGLRPSPARVREALSWLQQAGVVQAQAAADGRVRFRLDRGTPGVEARLTLLAQPPAQGCGPWR